MQAIFDNGPRDKSPIVVSAVFNGKQASFPVPKGTRESKRFVRFVGLGDDESRKPLEASNDSYPLR